MHVYDYVEALNNKICYLHNARRSFIIKTVGKFIFFNQTLLCFNG